MFCIIFADKWIRTADLCCRKQPLCQLSQNHCPLFFNFISPSYLRSRNSKCLKWNSKFVMLMCLCSCVCPLQLASISLFTFSKMGKPAPACLSCVVTSFGAAYNRINIRRRKTFPVKYYFLAPVTICSVNDVHL